MLVYITLWIVRNIKFAMMPYKKLNIWPGSEHIENSNESGWNGQEKCQYLKFGGQNIRPTPSMN